jgi:SAM-dependent methyltransferase
MQIERSAKEIVRHLILKSGLSKAYLAFRTARGQNVEHLRSQTLSERFSAIYRNRVWVNNRSAGSLSGLGSELENTKTIRQRLPRLLAEIGAKTVLDVGCGDFNWMSNVELGCAYIGIDIAPEVIALNKLNYDSPTRTFYGLDATRDRLPLADTVLCREVLFHLSFADIWAFIHNIRSSGALMLIATNDVVTGFNSDIVSGDFRILNLAKSPFRFPRPFLSIPDDEVSLKRTLEVWRVSDLPKCPKSLTVQ